MLTLEQVNEKIQKLQTQAQSLKVKRSYSVLNDIHKLLAEHGLTAEDVAAHSPQKKKGGRPATSDSAVSVSGKASTKKATKTAGKTAVKSTGAAAHRGQRTGPQPAKFRDPKSGATWSGRGPAPAWLAGAKDRSKFAVANEDSSASTASTPIVAVKKATAKKAVAKKAVAKKAVAKKAPAKKGVTAKTADNAVSSKAAKKLPGKKVPTKKSSPNSSATTVAPVEVEAVGSSTT